MFEKVDVGGSGPPTLTVIALADDAHVGYLGAWSEALSAAVRTARAAGSIGVFRVVISDATTDGNLRESVPMLALPGAATVSVKVVEEPTDWPPNLWIAGADLVLLTRPNVLLGPRGLCGLISALDDPRVGLAEPRRVPFQSAKPLDLRSGQVSWATMACCLIRPRVLEDVGALDLRSFPAVGADVDLSWRARRAGWTVVCSPDAVAFDAGRYPQGEPILGPSTSAAAARIRLAVRHGGMAVASVLAALWQAQGSPAEKRVATRFGRGRGGDPGSGSPLGASAPDAFHDDDADVFLPDLLAMGRSPETRPGSDDLSSVALYPPRPSGSAAEIPSGLGSAFLSVVVRTQGRRISELEDNLLSLYAQSCPDYEVLVMGHDLDDASLTAIEAVVSSFPRWFSQRVRIVEVEGGGRARPLNVAMQVAGGRYVSFLDDDDVALEGWVEAFHRVAEMHPGAIAWTPVAWQTLEPVSWCGIDMRRIIEPPQLFVPEFDLFAHLRQNGTPNCGLAVPMELVRQHELSFREDLPVFEDWDMILRLAQLAPIVSTGAVTALYRRGSSDNSGEVHTSDDWSRSSEQVIDSMDSSGFFVRGEQLPRLRKVLDELDQFRIDSSEGPDGIGRVPGFGSGPDDSDALTLGEHYFHGRRAVVVSPHLDDGVLSCGELISTLGHPRVLTVFAGGPSNWDQPTDWDLACGFSRGTNVVEARTSEDDTALAVLGATGERLGYLDVQYRPETTPPAVEEVGEAILTAVAGMGADTVFIPLGLQHADHRLVGAASAWASRRGAGIGWFAYQELPYAYEGDDVDDALDSLYDLAPRPVHLAVPGDRTLKASAIERYQSQLAGLGEHRLALALARERYWKLAPSLHPGGKGTSPDPRRRIT